MPLVFENRWSKLDYLGRGVECSKPGVHRCPRNADQIQRVCEPGWEKKNDMFSFINAKLRFGTLSYAECRL